MAISNISPKPIRLSEELSILLAISKIFPLVTILIVIGVYVQNASSQGQSLRIVDSDGVAITTVQVIKRAKTQYLNVDDVIKIFSNFDKRTEVAKFNPKRKRYIPFTGELTLQIAEKEISLVLNRKTVYIGGYVEPYNLSAPPSAIAGKPMLPVEFFTEVLSDVLDIGISYNITTRTLQLRLSEGGFIEPPQILPEPDEEFVMVLDPGKGGSDVGIKSLTGLVEKELTLEIAKAAQKLCTANGINLYLTRSSDKFLTSTQRATAENVNRGSLFISIHFNASFSPNHSGFRIYVNNPAGSLRYTGVPPGDSLQTGQLIKEVTQSDFLDQSRELAKIIFEEFELAGFAGKPVIEAPLITLNKVYMPAVLLSCGYLSNSSDVARFSQPESIQAVAQALFQVILTAKQKYHNNAEYNK